MLRKEAAAIGVLLQSSKQGLSGILGLASMMNVTVMFNCSEPRPAAAKRRS
jgi:hypothetical protein